MRITTKNEAGKREWSGEFLSSFKEMGVSERFNKLICGLEESGFERRSYLSYSPINNMVDMVLADKLVVRLYMVEIGELLICYRVGKLGEMDNEETDTIFRLDMDTIWEDVRRVWIRINL